MSHSPTPRLAVVDGWRALAALGVIWWHAWIHTGNPPIALDLGLATTNVQRWFVLLGNGVDLFFVLSGFCIFLTVRKSTANGLTPAIYGAFVAHRWLRLTPAFAVVALTTGTALFLLGQSVTVQDVLSHLTWTYTWWPGTRTFASSFWSLQIEWQFYLVTPLVLAAFGFKLRRELVLSLLLVSLAWRGWAHATPDGLARGNSSHLPEYLTAFVWGMLVADFWQRAPGWFGRLRGWPWLLAGFCLAYLGRGLTSTEAYAAAGRAGLAVKILCYPLMTLGFAVMLAATLNGVSGVSRWLSSAPMQWCGRHSYGLYLWHWWPCIWIGHTLIAALGRTVPAHYATLVLTLAVCGPLAWLTYRTCEQPYFGRKTPAALPTPTLTTSRG